MSPKMTGFQIPPILNGSRMTGDNLGLSRQHNNRITNPIDEEFTPSDLRTNNTALYRRKKSKLPVSHNKSSNEDILSND